MKLIPLGNGLFSAVDDADFEWISQYKWHAAFGGKNGCTYYAARNSPRKKGTTRKKLYMHHEILPKNSDLEVDHQDGNGLNNQRSNLRYATKSQNRANRRMIKHTSRFKGVHWDKRRSKWVSSIRVSGKQKELGRFSEEVEAARAYDKAAKELHGKFCVLNNV